MNKLRKENKVLRKLVDDLLQNIKDLSVDDQEEVNQTEVDSTQKLTGEEQKKTEESGDNAKEVKPMVPLVIKLSRYQIDIKEMKVQTVEMENLLFTRELVPLDCSIRIYKPPWKVHISHQRSFHNKEESGIC